MCKIRSGKEKFHVKFFVFRCSLFTDEIFCCIINKTLSVNEQTPLSWSREADKAVNFIKQAVSWDDWDYCMIWIKVGLACERHKR